MRVISVMFLLGCAGGSTSLENVGFEDRGDVGEACLSVSPLFLRLDAETPSAPVALVASCGFEASALMMLDDPDDVFEVDQVDLRTISDEVVNVEVRLVGASPGSYAALLTVVGDLETFKVELRGEITAE